MDKATKSTLENVICHYFYKLGQKMTNLKKANKTRLLEIIKKNSIDFDSVILDIIEYNKILRLKQEQKEKEQKEATRLYIEKQEKLYKKYCNSFIKRYVDAKIEETQKINDDEAKDAHKKQILNIKQQSLNAGIWVKDIDDNSLNIGGTIVNFGGVEGKYVTWNTYNYWIQKPKFTVVNHRLVPIW